MPLKIGLTPFKTPDDEMTYGGFIVRFEHKFIRNIYTYEQVKESRHLETLENYYEIYKKFISTSIGLLSILIITIKTMK